MYLRFAWRYFKAKKSTNAINIIAWISVVAIAVGTASLIILLSVFNGFEGLVKSLYADFYTDLKVMPASGKIMQVSAGQLNKLNTLTGIEGYSLVMEEKALLQNGDYQTIVYVKGVDSNYEHITNVANKLVRGRFLLGNADTPSTVLGSGIESAVEVESDRAFLPLTIYLPRKNSTMSTADPSQLLNADQIIPTGSFMIQQDFDNKYMLTNLAFLKRMLDMSPDEYGAIEIMLKDPEDEKKVLAQLLPIFGNSALIQNRYEQNKNLYSVMQLEKWFIYAALSLILVVAAFTMIGALTMLVLEKRKDIQVLKALGTNNLLIQKIFLAEGLLLAFLGGGAGALLAVLICWLQQRFHLIKMGGDSFLISYFPVKMIPGDFLLVLFTVFIVAIVASWFPSRKASLQPVALKSQE
ncbi:MAG: ABC transporter permease [Chitinophagaceae bacterium]|nr:ABC transporter permease [Chitinophagaceae bacterium]